MISDAKPTPDSGPPTRAGQMTSVMRAAPRAAGPRLLRAALVRQGRVVDERLIARGEHLTVGPTEHATFVVHAASIPRAARLIEHTREGYRLCPVPGVSGRIATDLGVIDVGEGERAARAIGPSSRGKLVLGDSIVLFHFVDPPARPPKAQLPLAVQKGIFGDLDWRTTFIAAFSFLFHFGAIGAMYSDWGDPVLDDEARVAQLIEIVKEMPAPPPIEQPKPNEDGSKPDKAAEAQTSKAPSSAGKSVASGPPRGPGSAGRMNESRAHEIANELRSINDAMVLAIGARANGATGIVLAAGNDAPLSMLDGVAKGPGGARPGDGSGLDLRGAGGGVVLPGKGGRGIDGADVKADARSAELGKQVEVKKPAGTTSVAPPVVSGGRVNDAGRVVAGLRGLLRACYKRELDVDPTARGSVRVTAQIAPNGDVKSVTAAPSGLSSSMSACVSRVVRNAQFSAPEGGGATVDIPMSFIPQ